MAKKVPDSVSVTAVPEGGDQEPGFYILEGDPEEDENGVMHETNMTLGKQVYASPDGEGFVYDKPSEAEEEE